MWTSISWYVTYGAALKGMKRANGLEIISPPANRGPPCFPHPHNHHTYCCYHGLHLSSFVSMFGDRLENNKLFTGTGLHITWSILPRQFSQSKFHVFLSPDLEIPAARLHFGTPSPNDPQFPATHRFCIRLRHSETVAKRRCTFAEGHQRGNDYLGFRTRSVRCV